MLPYEDVIWVGEELQRRFGLPYWQFALTATDANRFVLRMARMITERPKVLVFNYCYHGSVDETFITLDEEGTPMSRANNMGPQVDPLLHHQGHRVQRYRRARDGSLRPGCGGRAGRAGHDQYRHHPSRAWLS